MIVAVMSVGLWIAATKARCVHSRTMPGAAARRRFWMWDVTNTADETKQNGTPFTPTSVFTPTLERNEFY